MHRIAPCAPYLPRRASDTNKYDYGRVLIVGGCIGYTGAPTLCARAALRCGAGLVSVGVPEAIYAVTAVKNDEAMPFPLPSAEGKLARDALPVLLERLEKSDVCVLGPGLGRNDTLTALVQAVVMQSGTPLVLDADALFAVAQDAAVLERARAPIVLTPHDGEFARLAGPDKTGRAEAASDFAVRHGCTVVRKGPETVCAFPDGDAAVLRKAWRMCTAARNGNYLWNGRVSQADILPDDMYSLGGIAVYLGYDAHRGQHFENDLMGTMRKARDVAEHLFYGR